MRILIVDDDVDFAESFQDLFEFEGHEVAVCHSGEAALEALRASGSELVFLDVKLPGMTGMETLAGIRQIDQGLRVKMMTGYNLGDLPQQAAEYGVTCVMQKPLDIEHVVARLR